MIWSHGQRPQQSLKKIFCVILAFSLCIAPVVAQEQSPESGSISEEYNQGWLDGQFDAKGNGIWILSGLLLGPIGLILPWVINPKVPGARLIGKSVSYVQGYTAGYQKAAKPKNFYYSLIGFGVLAVVAVIGGVLAVQAASAATDSCLSNLGSACVDSCAPDINCSPDLGCGSSLIGSQ